MILKRKKDTETQIITDKIVIPTTSAIHAMSFPEGFYENLQQWNLEASYKLQCCYYNTILATIKEC